MSKKTILRLVGSITLLALLVWRLDLSQIATAFLKVEWLWWVLAMLAYMIAQIVSSVRWQILARPLGLERPLQRFVSLYFVGTFFNQLLPTSVGGDVMRAWHLDSEKGRRWIAFSSVFADRLTGLVALISLACIASCFVSLPGWILLWVISSGLGLLVGTLLLQRFPKVRKTVNQYRKHRASWIGAIVLSFAIQSLNVILVWLLSRGIGLNLSPGYCFILMPLVTLLTLLPISINGMGVREGGMILLLSPLGIASESAVLLSLLWFLVFASTGLIGGVVFFLGSFSKQKELIDDRSISRDSDHERARQSADAA